MSKKTKYIIKYIAFRFLPLFLLFGTMSTLLILMACTNNDPTDFAISIVVSAIALLSFFVYELVNILVFFRMIKDQERKYKVTFNDTNAKVFARYSLWIVCADNWLFRPGRFAVYRKEIKSAAAGDTYLDRRAIIYPVKIKMHSGKILKLKLTSEKQARAIRSWARR